MSPIKNIIFDFGGVIYDIDFDKAQKAFFSIGIKNFNDLYSQALQTHLFEKFEKDLVSPEEFREELRIISSRMDLTDQSIDEAWNALLVGFRQERINLLKVLKYNYQIFLFSNTNRIHYHYFLKQFQQITNYKSFDGLFTKSFFSFDIKRRKPDIESYKFLLSGMALNPGETLFIDDSAQNIKAAKETGLKCWHLRGELVDLFSEGWLKQEILDQLS